MKKRMWVLLLAGVLTFNQTGIVAFAQQTETKKEVRETGEADKTALTQLIEIAENYVDSSSDYPTVVGYTKESALNLIDAYLFAVGIVEDDTVIQDRVDEAVKSLEAAIKGLVVDKETLKELIDNSFNEDCGYFFTEASWGKYVNVYLNAKNTNNDPNATVEEVFEAIKELNGALAQLEMLPATEKSRNVLKDAISQAEKLEQADYTEASWKEFVFALEQAKVFSKDDTLSELNAVWGFYDLDEAMNNLVKVSTKPTDPTTPPAKPIQDPDKDEIKKEDSKKEDSKKDKKAAAKTADTSGIALLVLQSALAAGVGTTILKRRKEDEK